MFDTSNFDENFKRLLPIGENKKVSGIFKDKLGGMILKEVVALRPKTWPYLIDGYDDGDYEKNNIINKKAKGIKEAVTKNIIKFEHFKECLFNKKLSENRNKHLEVTSRSTPYRN